MQLELAQKEDEEEIVLDESKIPDSGVMLRSNGRVVKVFRLHGRYRAFSNSCPHEGGPVCEGTVTGMLTQGPETNWKPEWVKEGEILYCPWHGTAFDLNDGRSIVRQGLCIRSYPVSVSEGRVKVTLRPQ